MLSVTWSVAVMLCAKMQQSMQHAAYSTEHHPTGEMCLCCLFAALHSMYLHSQCNRATIMYLHSQCNRATKAELDLTYTSCSQAHRLAWRLVIASVLMMKSITFRSILLGCLDEVPPPLNRPAKKPPAPTPPRGVTKINCCAFLLTAADKALSSSCGSAF